MPHCVVAVRVISDLPQNEKMVRKKKPCHSNIPQNQRATEPGWRQRSDKPGKGMTLQMRKHIFCGPAQGDMNGAGDKLRYRVAVGKAELRGTGKLVRGKISSWKKHPSEEVEHRRKL